MNKYKFTRWVLSIKMTGFFEQTKGQNEIFMLGSTVQLVKWSYSLSTRLSDVSKS